MFDNQPTKLNQPEPPSNLPSEPVDMFAGVEKEAATEPVPSEQPDALSAGLLKRKPPAVQVPPSVAAENQPVTAPAVYAMKEPVLGKVLLLVAVVGVIGGLGWGGWKLYQKYSGQLPLDNNKLAAPVAQTTTTMPVVEKTAETAATTEDVGAGVVAKMNNDEILFGEPIDSDKDGLDDVRENELGTDPNQADSDNDGLRDSDEVLIWKTDPLNPDSDGDTYVDGKEVKNGYNPLGPGKLFNVPVSATTTVSASSTN